MKILHVCLGCFYIDDYSYQENMLPKYHKQLGHNVKIIASTLSFDKNGERCYVKPCTYVNEYGIKVTRVDYKKFPIRKINKFLRRFNDIYNLILDFKPNIIFIHGCQFYDISEIVNYAKNNDVTVYVDNHADFSNSARNFISKNFVHKVLWKNCAKKIEPYAKKFYGVLPARVDFLKYVYKINPKKVELLVMGCDDELAIKVNKPEVFSKMRKKYNIGINDFVIITGGKIDYSKQQIFLLLNAIKKIKKENIKLIIFGTVVDDMKEKLISFCSDNIIFVGWLNHEEIYKHLAMSDLAIYPGRHSVLWEETVGIGIPMLVKFWKGTTHIDVGGNVKFIKNDDEEEIKNKILDILKDNNYCKMKKIAQENGKKIFSYKEIAKKSLK